MLISQLLQTMKAGINQKDSSYDRSIKLDEREDMRQFSPDQRKDVEFLAIGER